MIPKTNSAAGRVAPRSLTFETYLLERWLPRTRTSEKTRRDRESHMRSYVIPRLGRVRLIDVTGDMLTEMYDDLAVNGRTTRPDPELGWGLSPTTVRRIHTQLNKAFNDAIRWGLLQQNPCTRADPPSTSEVIDQRGQGEIARCTHHLHVGPAADVPEGGQG